jgi:hypothetical protein
MTCSKARSKSISDTALNVAPVPCEEEFLCSSLRTSSILAIFFEPSANVASVVIASSWSEKDDD